MLPVPRHSLHALPIVSTAVYSLRTADAVEAHRRVIHHKYIVLARECTVWYVVEGADRPVIGAALCVVFGVRRVTTAAGLGETGRTVVEKLFYNIYDMVFTTKYIQIYMMSSLARWYQEKRVF